MNGFYSISRDHDDALYGLSGNDVKLYVYLVRRAAFRASSLCKVGELFDSLLGLSERSGLGIGSIRYGLQRLGSAGLISVFKHGNKHTICVTGYSDIGNVNTEPNTQITQRKHRDNTQITLLEETRSKEVKKEIEETPTFKSGKPEFEQERVLEFQKLWDRYPKRRGRKAALRHFMASVKTADDLAAINGALSSYLADLKFNGTSSQYTQNGSTWFNDWSSWIEVAKVRQVAPKVPAKPPEVLYEPTEADLKEMHLMTIKAVGRCLHADCRFCSKVIEEVSA